jgi:hypothetical protein
LDNQIKKDNIGRACNIIHGRGSKGVQVLIENPDAKRQFGRHGHRWEDNIKMDLTGFEREDVD